ncbi:MAG: DUF3990 domain-containing protein [Bacteroidales bacterium]|jgi:hypothetical protein|nr:DUF3990 domain-containing protein [Bacteroidales bacterium]
MKLYHGSTDIVDKPRILVSERYLDFGYGFYTTTNIEQARRWAEIKKDRIHGSTAYINVYKMDDTTLADKSFRLLEFRKPNRDWLEFVINNRRGKGGHNYDWVKGAVANDTLYQTLSLYESGILTVEETIVRLKVHRLFDQVSFHSEKILEKLHFVEARILS